MWATETLCFSRGMVNTAAIMLQAWHECMQWVILDPYTLRFSNFLLLVNFSSKQLRFCVFHPSFNPALLAVEWLYSAFIINNFILLHSRIFYVSHDSQDLQIFSFISKDDDIFKCSVFKASNKVLTVNITSKQVFLKIFLMVLARREA